MTRSAAIPAVVVATLLSLTACGARPTPGTTAGSEPSAAGSSKVCVGARTQGTRADLDGDGTADDVLFTQASGSSCPAGLTVSVNKKAVFERTDSLLPTSVRAVTLPGRKGQLLVARDTHPRGGFQDHVFAYADGRLAELTVAGHPLLPFVATDTPGSALGGFSASCADGGISVTRAVAHQPVGLAPAFDLVVTNYRIDDTRLVASSSRTVADEIHDGRLAATHPELSEHSVLTRGCR